MDAPSTINKHFLDSTNKTASSDANLKTTEKTKTLKLAKYRDREKKADNTCETISRKKFKLRNS